MIIYAFLLLLSLLVYKNIILLYLFDLSSSIIAFLIIKFNTTFARHAWANIIKCFPLKDDEEVYNILYDSWYDCGKAGYKSAYEILDKLTKVDVNKAKTMIQFRSVELVAKDK